MGRRIPFGLAAALLAISSAPGQASAGELDCMAQRYTAQDEAALARLGAGMNDASTAVLPILQGAMAIEGGVKSPFRW